MHVNRLGYLQTYPLHSPVTVVNLNKVTNSRFPIPCLLLVAFPSFFSKYNKMYRQGDGRSMYVPTGSCGM
jgi:hypothetical protein